MNFGPGSDRSLSSDARPIAAKVAGKMAAGKGTTSGGGRHRGSPGGRLVFVLALLLPLFSEFRSSFGAQSGVSKPQAQQGASSTETSTKLKSAISDLLQSYAKPLKPTLKEKALLGAIRTSAASSAEQNEAYRCAKHCTCSVIRVLDRVSNEHKTNLTQAKCESVLFADVLTIDRRTQIIHISLPSAEETSSQESGVGSDDPSEQQQVTFRMPRLVQFDILREIVIINLKLEVCDSEVFKRGQRLRRFQLNRNQLRRISKVCLKHLEKLVELNLDHNELAELESALFSSLLSLRSLSIAYNRLTELAAHQFANLTNLVSLNLVGNSFKTINLHLLEPMQNSLRLLVLAKNQIKSFVHAPIQTVAPGAASGQLASPNAGNASASRSAAFAGVVFKHLIKLNVDQNRVERIKLLQLHRFFNVKFLSIRQNNLATIRDKAFNGLKLIELNLAHNQLQTISKCAFCNATIRRLVLSHNNITTPLPSSMLLEPAPPAQPVAVLATKESQQLSEAPKQPAATSSQNMLILSQSIFGPLYGQLEYLDLSYNERLADQLDFLLEPLLKLEYLNLAAVGFDRSLPSPSLFKNLRQLRYLNLSHNQLDQVIVDTVEPLTQLESLDMSDNKFSELEESLLVSLDEISSLKLMNLAANPWHCSQCKVAPLYDWILRSVIYNQTCIAPSISESNQAAEATEEEPRVDPINALGAHQAAHDYSLLVDDDDKLDAALDFDLVLGGAQDGELLLDSYLATDSYGASQSVSFRELNTDEDDPSVAQTMASISTLTAPARYNPLDYCLKCEFPHELHTYNIHDLSPADFKFCAGAAPRFAASEPKIGLTLALVIIGALFCIIVVVVVMYRRKSNTYYTNEDTDQLNASAPGGSTNKKQMMSISSDADHQYDATDYSSPPMSQSCESYSDEDEEDDEEDDEEYDEDGDEEYDEGEEEEQVEEAEVERQEDKAGELQEELSAVQAADNSQELVRGADVERRQQTAGYARAESRTKQSLASLKSGSSPGVDSSSQARANPSSVSQRSQRRQVSSQSSSQQVAEQPALRAHWAEAGAHSSSAQTEPPPSRLQRSARSSQSTGSRAPASMATKQVKSSLSVGSGPTSSAGSSGSKEAPPESHQPVGRQRLALGPSLAGRKRAPPQSSQTLYQLASGLQPRAGAGGARSQSQAGGRRPNFSQFGRGRARTSREAASGNSSSGRAGSGADATEPEAAVQEPSRRGELQLMAHLAHVSHSPPALSDATTADSLALEQLDYAVSEEEELREYSGALELDAGSLEAELEPRPAHLQPGGRARRNQLGSTHSALTQTGSRD